jgi:hypothetical protein
LSTHFLRGQHLQRCNPGSAGRFSYMSFIKILSAIKQMKTGRRSAPDLIEGREAAPEIR